MLSCKEVSHLISEGAERKLTLSERIGLRIHLWMCDNCRRFEKQMHYMRQAMLSTRSSGDLPSEKPLPEDARERIRRKLQDQAGHTDD